MTGSLKDSNRWPLLGALTTNFAVYYLLTKGVDLSELKPSALAAHWNGLVPGSLTVVLCGFINSQLTALHKARIVFFRWHNPLPASRAFSHHAARDPRISMKRVQEKWAPLPNDPHEQNARWYGIYQEVKDSPAVASQNKSWLLARDYACLCAMLFVGLGVAGIFQMPRPAPWLLFQGIVLAQFFIARNSAVNHAERFITTVIAEASAKP